MKNVTTIGTSAPAASAAAAGEPPVPVAETSVVPTLVTGPIVLNDAQTRAAEAAVAKLSFRRMQNDAVVRIGYEAEEKLKKTLDAFLSALDGKNAEEVFKLFDRLQQGVQDAELPQVVTQLQTVDKPGILARIGGFFRGKSLSDLVREAYDKLRGVISGKTKTLVDVVSEVEKEGNERMKRLTGELQRMEQLKIAYRENFNDFAVAAVVAATFLEQSRKIVAEEETRVAQIEDPREKADLEDMRQRLALLESRSTNLVGSLTRLPADRLVIQQIQQAGVQTFQEMIITSGSRLASIKMNLLALNAGFSVKGVQLMAERQAKMDQQLTDIRGGLVRDVATTAATAPGDNRLKQAEQIKQIIVQTKEIDQIVKQAREQNATKFAAARDQFDEARKALAELN